MGPAHGGGTRGQLGSWIRRSNSTTGDKRGPRSTSKCHRESDPNDPDARTRIADLGKSEHAAHDVTVGEPHTEKPMFSSSDSEPSADVLDAIEEAEGRPTRVGELIRFPDRSEFNPVRLEGRIEHARVEQLLAGETPTMQELELWRTVEMREHGMQPPRYHMVSLWEHRGEGARGIVWANLHEDQGTVWERIGPCRTVREIEERLTALGQLRWNAE